VRQGRQLVRIGDVHPDRQPTQPLGERFGAHQVREVDMVALAGQLAGQGQTVVVDPYATVAGVSEAGRVAVFYGDPDGRIGEGDRAVVN
jgi:hypothetical protein